MHTHTHTHGCAHTQTVVLYVLELVGIKLCNADANIFVHQVHCKPKVKSAGQDVVGNTFFCHQTSPACCIDRFQRLVDRHTLLYQRSQPFCSNHDVRCKQRVVDRLYCMPSPSRTFNVCNDVISYDTKGTMMSHSDES